MSVAGSASCLFYISTFLALCKAFGSSDEPGVPVHPAHLVVVCVSRSCEEHSGKAAPVQDVTSAGVVIDDANLGSVILLSGCE